MTPTTRGKYQIQVDKLTQLAAKAELNSNQIEPVLVTTRPLKTIVDSYHDKVKTLPDPAKKELTALLAAIEADIHSWGQLAVTLQSGMPSGPTNAQKVAASALQRIEDPDQVTHKRLTAPCGAEPPRCQPRPPQQPL